MSSTQTAFLPLSEDFIEPKTSRVFDDRIVQSPFLSPTAINLPHRLQSKAVGSLESY
jgi:hypothetical protein